MQSLRLPLRIVFYRDEDGDWIAHCLEFDLAGDGATKEAALASLSAAIEIQVAAVVRTGNPSNLFTPADGEYFRMFAEGKDTTALELTLDAVPLDIGRTEYREYSGATDELLVS